MKSLLEVVQHVGEPPYVVNQLHHILWVRSGCPHQVRRQAHAAQRVLGVSAHVPGLGGPHRQRSCVWLGVVFEQSLGALCPTAAAAAAAVALPEHPSTRWGCHPFQGGLRQAS